MSDPETSELDDDGVTESDDEGIDGDGNHYEIDLFPRDVEERYDSDGGGGGDS